MADNKASQNVEVAEGSKESESQTNEVPMDPPKLDLSNVRTQEVSAPSEGRTKMDEKSKAGVDLAHFVLWSIAGFIVLAALLLIFYECQYGDWVRGTSSSLEQLATQKVEDQTKLLEALDRVDKALQQERDSYREHWMKFVQMALLNLFLPVLTAILGYVFGTREGNNESKKDLIQ